MILDKTQLEEELKKGELKITPLNRKNMRETAIYLTLSNEFRAFKKHKTILLAEKPFLWKENSEKVVLKKNQAITLPPNGLVLGITREKIKMPRHLCGWINGRSMNARLGLLVHASANFIHPGVENKQVLELANLSPNNLVLTPGMRICYVIFERISGKQKYSGVFAKQDSL